VYGPHHKILGAACLMGLL